MSEQANMTASVRGAHENVQPVRSHRFARAMGNMTLATGLATGLTMGASELIFDDPYAAIAITGYKIGEGLSSCDPIDPQDVQKMESKLKSDVDAAQTTDPRSPYNVFEDFSILASAKKYGLSVPDNAKDVYNDIKSITQPEYGWMAASVLNSYTKREYGFTVDSANFGSTTSKDAAAIVAELYPIPKEIVKAVTGDDLEKVHLDAPTQKMEYYKAQSGSKAAGEYQPSMDTINIASTYADALPHELGHALRKTASHEDCTFPTTSNIPDFDNANPKGFVYGHDNKGWDKVTLDQYAAQGDSDATEDYATVAGKVFNPHPTDPKDCGFDQSAVINHKKAVVLAAVEREVPGGGAYLSEQLAHQGKC